MLTNLFLRQAAEETPVLADVFSSTGYTGDGQSFKYILNSINLSSNAGMVWLKSRGGTSADHIINDTIRGTQKDIRSNSNSASGSVGVYSFNSNGFTLIGSNGLYNGTSIPYISWTFRKAPKFFDIVQFSGNNSSQVIPHSLGVEPGMMLVKNTTSALDWRVYHRSLLSYEYLVLNNTGAKQFNTGTWSNTYSNSSNLYFGYDTVNNVASNSYIAYVFANDTSASSIIKTGSYTGNGSSIGVNLGFSNGVSYLLIKRVDNTGNWYVWDKTLGITASNDYHLSPNLNTGEQSANSITPFTNGFIVVQNVTSNICVSGATYIYLAIA